jgi:sterol desaturase/sphingolipid hydroxylase (fatty acid hydroxylase superfamily)
LFCADFLQLADIVSKGNRMNWQAIGITAAWAVGGFVFSSFMEYWGHRWIHTINWGPGITHREHHARGTAQGVLLEFWDYFKYGWLLMWPPFLISMAAGIGWVVGSNAFILFSSFAHQLQHENPKKCFWMPMPIHYVHHANHQWHHNFGMALDVWDRIFGTYKPLGSEEELPLEQIDNRRHVWQVNWLWGGNAEADQRMEEMRRQKAEGKAQKTEV